MSEDERELMKAAMDAMKEAFIDACSLVPDYDKQGELQGRYFDGHQEAKRAWGMALVKRDVLGKEQEALYNEDGTVITRQGRLPWVRCRHDDDPEGYNDY